MSLKHRLKYPYKYIGYTNDRETVFMTQDGADPQGRPMEFTLCWSPRDAEKVADALMSAVRACKHSIIVPG